MAKFSKAHYEILTQAIVKAKKGVDPVVVERVAYSIGLALEKDNSSFSLVQFMSNIRGYRVPSAIRAEKVGS